MAKMSIFAARQRQKPSTPRNGRFSVLMIMAERDLFERVVTLRNEWMLGSGADDA